MIHLLLVADTLGVLTSLAKRELVTSAMEASLGQRDIASLAEPGNPASPSGRIAARAGAVSRSRSRGWHAFALGSTFAPLGIDIERAERSGQAFRARRAFLGSEDLPVGDDHAAALRVFVRKEAILKARGVGFRDDPRRQPTAVLEASGTLVTADGWWLCEPDVEGLQVCVATRERQELTIFQADTGLV
jgi:phosphopantetheinyl transferase